MMTIFPNFFNVFFLFFLLPKSSDFILFVPQRALCLAQKNHQLVWLEVYLVTITTSGTACTGDPRASPVPAGPKGRKSGMRGTEGRKEREETSLTSRMRRTGELFLVITVKDMLPLCWTFYFN